MSTPKKKVRKPKSWAFWMGFSDGKPFVFRHEFTAPAIVETVLSVSAYRSELRTQYEDVRRVRITEVTPS